MIDFLHLVDGTAPAPSPPAAPAMSQPMRTMTSQLTDECYTPVHIADRAHQCLGGIDLDPASCEIANRQVRAARYYTKTDNGYMQPWAGRVFLNPPFTNNQVPRWVKRLGTAYDDGDVTAAVLLVNSAPGYDWWEELWESRPVVVLRRRLTFHQESGELYGDHHKKGQTVAYYGPDVRAFIRAFGDLGRVLLPGPYLSELCNRLDTLQTACARAKAALPPKGAAAERAWHALTQASGLADLAIASATKLAGQMEAGPEPWAEVRDAA